MDIKSEHVARIFIILLVFGSFVAVISARIAGKQGALDMHGRMAETGGWTPDVIQAEAGKPLLLRLTSDDVVHGFAVGQFDFPDVDIEPGKVTEITLDFQEPGKYTFYCTRWCGLNHWRMRGTIDVSGEGKPAIKPDSQPLYVTLALNLDAPHEAAVVPDERPQGSVNLLKAINPPYLDGDYYRSHAPDQVFTDLRGDGDYERLSDAEIWDLVAGIWRANTTTNGLLQGKELYSENCAACHGEGGRGDGVFADDIEAQFGKAMSGMENISGRPTDFTNAGTMFGASPALVQGKIVRGGMGTGMPYWGPIFTDEQTWNLVAYLYSFTMSMR